MKKQTWMSGILMLAGLVVLGGGILGWPALANAQGNGPLDGVSRWFGLAAVEQSASAKTAAYAEVSASGVTLKFGVPALVQEPAWTSDGQAANESWSVLKVPVCQPTIDGHDYGCQNVRLFVGNVEVKVDYFGQTLDYFVTTQGGKGLVGRCDTVSVVVPPAQDLSRFSLQLETMRATDGPEVPDCAAAQAKLNTARAGVQFRCDASGQQFGFVITGKPSALSEGQARQLVLDTLVPTLHGAWRFDGGVTK